MVAAGLGPEKYYAVEAQQQLQTTDPSSRQRTIHINKPAPNGCLTPRQSGRLSVVTQL
jgi:hypothetical protein